VFVVKTPNLLKHGVMGNAVASNVMREKWRLRLVYGSDGRQAEDFFPVRYRANTMRSLVRLLKASGLQVHKAIGLPQNRPFSAEDGKARKASHETDASRAFVVCPQTHVRVD
jgi:hypothetical protein